jgi:dCMP deaminase
MIKMQNVSKMGKWDLRFMQLAAVVKRWSKDPSVGVGAVVVGADRRNVALGYNGLPPTVPDDCYLSRPDKNRFMLHAERNAIDNAHFDTRGGCLYTTKPVCGACASALVSAGLVRVVMPELHSTSNWYEDQSAAFDFLNDVGIDILIMEE